MYHTIDMILKKVGGFVEFTSYSQCHKEIGLLRCSKMDLSSAMQSTFGASICCLIMRIPAIILYSKLTSIMECSL